MVVLMYAYHIISLSFPVISFPYVLLGVINVR